MVGNDSKLKGKEMPTHLVVIFLSPVLLIAIGQCLFINIHSRIYFFICSLNYVQNQNKI